MAANNFFFNTDPLLGARNYDEQLGELNRLKESIEHRQQLLKQARAQAVQTSEQQPQQQQSQSPIWDEIETIVSGMTEKEFELVTNSDEFIESQNVIMGILQAQYMRIMRPIVEGCKEGKDALENHLTIVKRLRKAASLEVDKEINDFNEYKEKYSDIPYSEYQKMKRSKKAKK